MNTRKKRQRRPVYGKMEKTIHLRKHAYLYSFVPRTLKFNWINVKTMLKKHKLIYIKPDKGMHGNHVYKVEMLSPTNYKYQIGTTKKSFTTFRTMFYSINNDINGSKFLVQRGIRLLHYNGKPFDIRIMIQRDLSTRKWHVNGMVCRIAGPRLIITNYNKGKTGGTVKTIEAVLSPYMSKQQIVHKKQYLRKLGKKVANHFEKKYPNLNEIGLDVVFDQKLRPWFLEVNTTYPSKRLFKLLPNKTMHRRIAKFRKQYKI